MEILLKEALWLDKISENWRKGPEQTQNINLQSFPADFLHFRCLPSLNRFSTVLGNALSKLTKAQRRNEWVERKSTYNRYEACSWWMLQILDMSEHFDTAVTMLMEF